MNDQSSIAGAASNADTDPTDITIESLTALLDDVMAAKEKHYIVIAVYALPKDCVIGSRSGGHDVGGTPDGLTGVPPGRRNAIYRFPIVDKVDFARVQLASAVIERFKKANEVQAVVATSNHLYAQTAFGVEKHHHPDRA